MSTAPAPAQTPPLQCMEIWGGNAAVEKAVGTPGLDLWVSSRPYEGAAGGGDVHYVSLCGGGETTRFILADVAGHGASVADLAKSLRDLMRTHINRKDQTRLVQALNQEFAQLSKAGRFATAVVATYLTRSRKLTVCNAGHPRPLYRRAAAGEWVALSHDAPAPGIAGLPLGVLDDTGYTTVGLTLRPGDILLVYTDALTEAEDPAGNPLGEAGLLDLVRRLDPTRPADLPAALLAALDAFRGGRPAGDDQTFLLLHHTTGPPRPPRTLRAKLDVYAKVFGLKAV